MKRFVLTLLSGLFSASVLANALTIEQLTKDITFLADDKLAGRSAFSPEIDIAADYIANRFAQIGLQPLSKEQGFKQTFNVFQITSQVTKLALNNENIDSQQAISLTSHSEFEWTNKNKPTFEFIAADKDFRSTMSTLNQKNEDMLVLVDKKHTDIFNRYRQFFSRGQTKFAKDSGPSAVFVLTDVKQVDNIHISVSAKVEQKQLTNVVGILPGKSRVNEKVLFSAHYDHIGTNDKLEGDKIYNGADDDATGTTAVLNLAQYYANKKDNARTLMFVAFTAEEIGGYGSKYFSQQLDPASITAMLNIEMIGKPSKFGAGKLWMTGYERSDLAKLLNESLEGAQIYPDPYIEQQLFYRSDNATLAQLGVPAHSFSSSQIDIDKHYHKVSDEVATLDLGSMFQAVETLARASEGLVNGNVTPSRVDTSQVRKSGNFY